MVILQHEAQLAVLKILIELQNADNIVHANEVAYADKIRADFHITKEELARLDMIAIEKAVATIAALDTENKLEITKMMGQMIVCDSDINYKEVQLYNSICCSLGLNEEFDYDENSDIKHS